jgi:putative hemolysin
VLRIRPGDDPNPTEEEIRALLKQATHAGEVEPVEQQIVDKVFHLGDRRVNSLMTARVDIEWIDVHSSRDELIAELAARRRERLLVCDGELDHVVGVVYTEDLLADCVQGKPLDLYAAARQPVFVPETVTAFALLERFRAAHTHTALVVDEYGAVQGIVTLTDIREGLFGALPDQPSPGWEPITQRADGSWLVDGGISIDELRASIALPEIREAEAGQFETLAGLIMTRLSRLPKVGDHITWNDLRFEVVDMDGRRVDKVLITPQTPPATSPAP